MPFPGQLSRDVHGGHYIQDLYAFSSLLTAYICIDNVQASLAKHVVAANQCGVNASAS